MLFYDESTTTVTYPCLELYTVDLLYKSINILVRSGLPIAYFEVGVVGIRKAQDPDVNHSFLLLHIVVDRLPKRFYGCAYLSNQFGDGLVVEVRGCPYIGIGNEPFQPAFNLREI